MATLYRNFLSGTITDNPLSDSATTINSAGFEFLPTITTDQMWLVLDPDGSAGAPEICRITAHSAAATSVTVAARDESAGNAQLTVNRSHVSGTEWVIALTQADVDELIADIAALQSELDTTQSELDTAEAAIVDLEARIPQRATFTMTSPFNCTSGLDVLPFDTEVLDEIGLVNSAGVITVTNGGLFMLAFTCDTSASSPGNRIFRTNAGGTANLTPSGLAVSASPQDQWWSHTLFMPAGATLEVIVGGNASWVIDSAQLDILQFPLP
jgi:hypothetical protein